jgi:hypothetical protein
MSSNGDQARDAHGRWAGEGATGAAKAKADEALTGLSSALRENARRGREFAEQSSGDDKRALISEASKNDRHAETIGRAQEALRSGDTKLASHLAGKVGVGEIDAHDHHETTVLGKSEGSAETRTAEHVYISTHYGDSLSVSDVLHNVHEDDRERGIGRDGKKFTTKTVSGKTEKHGNRVKAEKALKRAEYQRSKASVSEP